MGLSGVVSLMALSGCSRVAPSSVWVGSVVVLGFSPVGGSFGGGFSSSRYIGVRSSHLILLKITEIFFIQMDD